MLYFHTPARGLVAAVLERTKASSAVQFMSERVAAVEKAYVVADPGTQLRRLMPSQSQSGTPVLYLDKKQFVNSPAHPRYSWEMMAKIVFDGQRYNGFDECLTCYGETGEQVSQPYRNLTARPPLIVRESVALANNYGELRYF